MMNQLSALCVACVLMYLCYSTVVFAHLSTNLLIQESEYTKYIRRISLCNALSIKWRGTHADAGSHAFRNGIGGVIPELLFIKCNRVFIILIAGKHI